MSFYIGVDLHKTQFTVHVRTETACEAPEKIRVYSTKPEGYAAFLERLEMFKSTGEEVKIGVESTGNTRYFKTQAEKAGAKVAVINTLKFKVITESAKKTDKHDAMTISEFLSKDMLPESYLCGRETVNIRLLLTMRKNTVHSVVEMKNEVHSLLVAAGLEDLRGSLQSKKGRQKVLDALKSHRDCVLEAQSVELTMAIIEQRLEEVKALEKKLAELTKGNEMVERLMTIRGCGKITAWTIFAYVEDISRFPSAKKFAAYCGLVPWVSDSNKTVRHGKITKHGPQDLRTAFVQLVMGLRRRKDTSSWRLMQRYESLKRAKGSGKSIVATARKLAEIVWTMLSDKADFDENRMKGRYKPMSERERLEIRVGAMLAAVKF